MRGGRSKGTALPEGEIAAQHRISRTTECCCHCDQQGCAAIAAGAMSEDEIFPAGLPLLMKKAANGRLFQRRNGHACHSGDYCLSGRRGIAQKA